MRCPFCNNVIAFEADGAGANGIEAGDTIIRKAVTVVKDDGSLHVKCSGCKNLVALPRKVVFKLKTEKG